MDFRLALRAAIRCDGCHVGRAAVAQLNDHNLLVFHVNKAKLLEIVVEREGLDNPNAFHYGVADAVSEAPDFVIEGDEHFPGSSDVGLLCPDQSQDFCVQNSSPTRFAIAR